MLVGMMRGFHSSLQSSEDCVSFNHQLGTFRTLLISLFHFTGKDVKTRAQRRRDPEFKVLPPKWY